MLNDINEKQNKKFKQIFKTKKTHCKMVSLWMDLYINTLKLLLY